MAKQFDHPKTGWKLVLKFDEDELTQEHVEAFMAAFQKDKRGPSTPEYNGKVVTAALAAGWIESAEPSLAAGTAKLPPRVVRWMAERIDALYAAALEVPKD